MKLESLRSNKFTPLAKNSMAQVIGGQTTLGGKELIKSENRFENGQHFANHYYRTWSSDERSQGSTCYNDEEFCWTGWH